MELEPVGFTSQCVQEDGTHGGSGDTITPTGNRKFALHGTKRDGVPGGSNTSIDDLSQGMTLVLSGSPGTETLSDFAQGLTGVVH